MITAKKNVLTFYENCLNYFFTEMYGDQFGEFVCGYWESACMTV